MAKLMEDQVPTQPAPAPPPRKNPQDIGKSSDFYLWMGILGGLILLAALVLAVAGRWMRRRDTSAEDSLSLTNFREMFEAGELTQAEYEKIRNKMAGKMKQKLGVTPPAAPPVDPPPKSE